jgi:hypothetical protein
VKYVPLEFFAGVTAILVIAIIAGKPLRRHRTPRGPVWRYIGLGAALFVLAGVLSTFPPHSVLLAVLVMLTGVVFFSFGIAILGGGNFGYLGALASGLAAVPFLMTPTPVALAHFGTRVNCTVRDYHHFGVTDFTADCPDGHSYDFKTSKRHEFPGGQVQVIVDPHGVLRAQFVGQEHVTRDLVAGIGGLVVASGIVVAAYLNRRRRGQVRPVVSPRYTSGP